jgi:hypothetical protein
VLHEVGQRTRSVSSGATLALLVGPLLGAVLVAVASRSAGLYRVLVREDALLEWAQVIAYVWVIAFALVATPRLWRSGYQISTLVLVALAFVSLVSVGEELSWGQRLIGFGTPEIAASNRQGELTLHNDARFEGAFRMGILAVGVYGFVAPFVVRRRTPLVPPRRLVMFFAVVTAYYTARVLLLEAPTYVEAKYSEWPESCLAIALALWSVQVGAAGWRPVSVQRLENRSIEAGRETGLRILTRRTSSRAGTAGDRD